jgi:hypothetical protein
VEPYGDLRFLTRGIGQRYRNASLIMATAI